MDSFDFSGWATKANLKCSDGRTIMKDAFKHNDGKTVPLVWNHQHNDPNEVLGHALLENRDEGVYAYCKFNDTETGKTAKLLVQHGDVVALSIYANQLKQNMNHVIHGNIREVSLVLAGANPGAFIDSVMVHGEESDEEAFIYTGEPLELAHADCGGGTTENKEEKEEAKMAEENKEKSEKTINDVFETFTDEQKEVVYAIAGKIAEMAGETNNETKESEGGNDKMKQNVFDQDEKNKDNVLSHDAMNTIISDAKRYGSLKESFLAHAGTYGITNIDTLFPDAKTLNNTPEFI